MIATPEILAPAGDADSVRAAILAGADAVYLGLDRFNARMRAVNIRIGELAELTRLAHSHGVRLYVTLNVLLSQEEVSAALELAVEALNAGADALILQDWGLLGLLRSFYPEVEIHASTQLTTHNSRQIDLLSTLGVAQLNLCRELSLEEIRGLVRYSHQRGIKAEVFVHGAYCISFSGQCYLSAYLCGLSGNRGQCVQPCRRNYFIRSSPGEPTNKKPAEKTDRAHRQEIPFLNLKDNNALSEASSLIAAEIDAFKIEGRRKGFYYVYTVVQAWRKKLFSCRGILSEETPRRQQLPKTTTIPSSGIGRDEAVPAEELVHRVYNRGFDIGYLTGQISPEMFSDSGEDHALVPIGTVAIYNADQRILRTNESIPMDQLDREMAVSIFADASQEQFVAQVVIEKRLSATSFQVRIQHELRGRILHGQRLFRLPYYKEAEALAERIRSMKVRKIPLGIRVGGSKGTPLITEFYTVADSAPSDRSALSEYSPSAQSQACADIISVRVESAMPLTPALRNPLTIAVLKEHFGKLGDSMYQLDSSDSSTEAINIGALEQGLFLPVSELNRMRREAIVALDLRIGRSRPALQIPDSLGFITGQDTLPSAPTGSTAAPFQLTLDVFHHLKTAPLPDQPFQQRILPLFSDPEDIALAQAAQLQYFLYEVRLGIRLPEEPGLIPWFPAIILDKDLSFFEKIIGARSWPWVVSDNSGLGWKAAQLGVPWMAGPLLNVTNAWSAATLRHAAGAGGVIFSTELNRRQLITAAKVLRPIPDNNGAAVLAIGKSTSEESPFRTAAIACGPILAMNTRQCLVRRFKHCSKEAGDADCLPSCSASGRLDGGSERLFHAVKRAGTYSQLWDARLLFIPEMQALQGGYLDLLVIDLRDPGFLKLDPPLKARLLQSFLLGKAESLSAVFRRRGIATTNGLFDQGLT